MSLSPLEEAFLWPQQSYIKPHKQIYMCTHSHTTGPWSAAFPLPLHTRSSMSAPIMSTVHPACSRSFYFWSVFPFCKWAQKHRLCLHLSLQYHLVKSYQNAATLSEIHFCVLDFGLWICEQMKTTFSATLKHGTWIKYKSSIIVT